MKIFILEDDPGRMLYFREQLIAHDITHIDTCEAIAQFQPPYDIIFLDHDLGGRQLEEREDCGMAFVDLIKDKLIPDKDQVLIHSYNKAGAERMLQALTELEIDAVWAPYRGDFFNGVIQTVVNIGKREQESS